MEDYLPGVFSAAGLIVPDPSIKPPPIPFIDADAGTEECDVEYIVTNASLSLWPGVVGDVASQRPCCWCASAPGARWRRWKANYVDSSVCRTEWIAAGA
ncbi:hypothetical protein MMC21_001462 [Puttea exsequens]|nr:hypothetical protein [Puttea exsequens]